MTFKEFIQLINEGAQPAVEFSKYLECCDFDKGMRTRCLSTEDNGGEGYECFIIYTNFSEFKDFNKSLENKNWYAKNERGNEILVGWSESQSYPADGKVLIYLTPEDWNDGVLKIIEPNNLFDEFKASGDTNYVSWLEQQVLSLREHRTKLWEYIKEKRQDAEEAIQPMEL